MSLLVLPSDVYFIIMPYMGLPEIFTFISVSIPHAKMVNRLLSKRFDICKEVWTFLLKDDRKRVMMRKDKQIILNDIYMALSNIEIKGMTSRLAMRLATGFTLHEMYVRHRLKDLINRHRISRAEEIKRKAMSKHRNRHLQRRFETVENFNDRMIEGMGRWIPHHMKKYNNYIIPPTVFRMLNRSHGKRCSHFSRTDSAWIS